VAARSFAARERTGRAPPAARTMHVGRGPVAARFAIRVVVGAVHGLAGSGALVALATRRCRRAARAVVHAACSVFGSIAAMSAISGFAGWPLARRARSPTARAFCSVAGGTMSLALGISWAGSQCLSRVCLG
jgi:hypothetical protein